MKHLFFTLILVFFTTSQNYAQENTSIPVDSMAIANAIKDAEALKRIEKAEKEAEKAEKAAKKAEKKAKSLEKEAKKAEKLEKNISSQENLVEKTKNKIANLGDKLSKGKANGKLSPVDIMKLESKITKEKSNLVKAIEKLEKLQQK